MVPEQKHLVRQNRYDIILKIQQGNKKVQLLKEQWSDYHECT